MNEYNQDSEYIYDARLYFDPEKERETIEYRNRRREALEQRYYHNTNGLDLNYPPPWNNVPPGRGHRGFAGRRPFPVRGAFLRGRFLKSGRFLQRGFTLTRASYQSTNPLYGGGCARHPPHDVWYNPLQVGDIGPPTYDRDGHFSDEVSSEPSKVSRDLFYGHQSDSGNRESDVDDGGGGGADDDDDDVCSNKKKSKKRRKKSKRKRRRRSSRCSSGGSGGFERSFKESCMEDDHRKDAAAAVESSSDRFVSRPRLIDDDDDDDDDGRGEECSSVANDNPATASPGADVDDRTEDASTCGRGRLSEGILEAEEKVAEKCQDVAPQSGEWGNADGGAAACSQGGRKRQADENYHQSRKKKRAIEGCNGGKFLLEEGPKLQEVIKRTARLLFGLGNAERFSEIKTCVRSYLRETHTGERIKVFLSRRIKRRCSEVMYFTEEGSASDAVGRSCKDDSLLTAAASSDPGSMDRVRRYRINRIVTQLAIPSNQKSVHGSSNDDSSCTGSSLNHIESFPSLFLEPEINSAEDHDAGHNRTTVTETETKSESSGLKSVGEIGCSSKSPPRRSVYSGRDSAARSSTRKDNKLNKPRNSSYENLQIMIQNSPPCPSVKHSSSRQSDQLIRHNVYDLRRTKDCNPANVEEKSLLKSTKRCSRGLSVERFDKNGENYTTDRARLRGRSPDRDQSKPQRVRSDRTRGGELYNEDSGCRDGEKMHRGYERDSSIALLQNSLHAIGRSSSHVNDLPLRQSLTGRNLANKRRTDYREDCSNMNMRQHPVDLGCLDCRSSGSDRRMHDCHNVDGQLRNRTFCNKSQRPLTFERSGHQKHDAFSTKMTTQATDIVKKYSRMRLFHSERDSPAKRRPRDERHKENHRTTRLERVKCLPNRAVGGSRESFIATSDKSVPSNARSKGASSSRGSSYKPTSKMLQSSVSVVSREEKRHFLKAGSIKFTKKTCTDKGSSLKSNSKTSLFRTGSRR